jgi:hypothetical protein
LLLPFFSLTVTGAVGKNNSPILDQVPFFPIRNKDKIPITITKKIILEDKYLDSDIVKHIQNKVSETMKGECSYEHGYVLDVVSVNKIISNIILSSSAEAAFADKHTHCVSWSAKCMPMVQMEGSLLPAVLVDADMQSDNPCDHGERQDGQGNDE